MPDHKPKPDECSSKPAGSRNLARRATGISLSLLLFGIIINCRPAAVRVKVSAEDLTRANIVAGEGDVCFARKDYYAALIKYLEAGRLNPNSEYVFNKMGITYSRLRFYTEAIGSFRRSLELNPKYSYSYNNLGSVYFADNNRRKAEECFRKAISLKSDEASFHVNLGTLLFENKKFEDGLAELRKGLALDPDILRRNEGSGLVAAISQRNTAEKNYFMARFYASQGDVDRAVENLELALANGFTNLEALRTEKDFDPIRKQEKFIAFMKYAAQVIKG
jgi:tetratricopeptide (TPR) repeat protein